MWALYGPCEKRNLSGRVVTREGVIPAGACKYGRDHVPNVLDRMSGAATGQARRNQELRGDPEPALGSERARGEGRGFRRPDPPREHSLTGSDAPCSSIPRP